MVVFVEHVSRETDWQGLGSGSPPSPADYAEGAGRKNIRRQAFGLVPKTRRTALLNRVVTTEILPRLALIRRASGIGDDPPRPVLTTHVDTGALVARLLENEPADCLAFVDALVRRGATAEALYIGILPDAARWLGLMWEEDCCDFVQVAIALGRLQQATRMLSPRFQADSVSRAEARNLLLLPAPDEQHTFGLMIVAEFFQRAGWHVTGGPGAHGTDAAGLARQTWFDVVGFSIGSGRSLDGLVEAIRMVRHASLNRAVTIMVGGPLIEQRPDLAAAVGADIVASDAFGAVRTANKIPLKRAAAE